MRSTRCPLRLIALAFVFTVSSFSSAFSRQLADTNATLQAKAPKVYIDCPFCDEDFIRTEITFVNYVRDRLQADIHVLTTTQSTGSGGTEYTITFIGQNAAAGAHDTLVFTTKQFDTQETIRNNLVKTLKLGLVRYAAKTPLGEYLTVSYSRPSASAEVTDQWDYWVFRINANSNLNGEKISRDAYLSGGISARRVTKEWKLNFALRANYNESSFDIDDTTRIFSFARGQNFNSYIVRSIDDHWSVGGYASGYSDTYDNTKLQLSIAPAVEYNIFPYSESTRRQLRLLYRISYKSVKYLEETIYEKLSERLFNHSLSVSLEMKQQWGSSWINVEGFQYLHDLGKKSLRMNTGINLKLWEGLSLNLYGGYSRINDQLSLPKGGATQEEILLQRTQLATNYRYWMSVGLSYTFGSIFNNIVNPRFGDSGGGFFFFD